MFRATDTNIQLSMFDTPADFMGKRALKKYDDPKAWFNQFYELVTSQFDETTFKPLFKAGNMGAPTASIHQLVAMSILKEGFGCSDEDLLTRKALGLVCMEDETPSLDTYHLFRRRICEYADETGFYAAKFKISGRAVRMDSKLIVSNIAWYPRYEFVHETFLQEIEQYTVEHGHAVRQEGHRKK